MEGEIKSLLNVWLTVLACLCYSYFISPKIPKGRYRLISLLPILTIFTFLPLSFSYAFPTGVAAFFITWLASFKLLLFSFDLGPLSSRPPMPLHRFIAIACLPVKIKPSSPSPVKPAKKLPLNLPTEALAFSVLMGVVREYRGRFHPNAILVFYCLLTFLIVDILVAVSGAAIGATIGLELERPSDEPYLATSLQDFWGRRWNLTVINLLRHSVYKPVRSALAPMPLVGGARAPLAAVVAAFLVSGLMHELLFYYVTRVPPTWEMTSFFVLHGACVAAEVCVKRALTDRWRLHRSLSAPLTVGFVMATSFWLFFPPIMEGGADVRVIEEFAAFGEFMKRGFEKLYFLVG